MSLLKSMLAIRCTGDTFTVLVSCYPTQVLFFCLT